MNKPLMIIRKELIESVVSVINTSGLPPVITVPIFEGLASELRSAMNEQLKMEEKQWSEYQKSIEDNKDDE